VADLFKKYGFAAVLVGALALILAAVGAKEAVDALTGDKARAGAGGPPGGAMAGGPQRPGGGAGGPGGPGGARGEGRGLQVAVAAIEAQPFYDVVQTIGTAQAQESIVVASKVTEVIRAIRFESGDLVNKGQVLVELGSVEQQADLSEARANLEVVKREYDRFAELGERGFAPKARVEEARAAFDRAQARVEALQARIADRTIRAPFAGVMGLRTASPGTLATPGAPIATLDDIRRIKLDFDVPEPQLGRVRSGVDVVATSAAYPGETFSGQVDDIDSRVDPRTRTVKVRAMLDNQDRRLKPGMLLNVRVRTGERSAIAAPEMALLEEGASVYVFRVVEDEGRTTVARAPVTLGARADGMAEILSGLEAGDRVVTEGVQRVRPGMPISVAPALAAPGEAPPAARPARRT
jgi:membrane fusion protein (multidrug efflux system)